MVQSVEYISLVTTPERGEQQRCRAVSGQPVYHNVGREPLQTGDDQIRIGLLG